MPDETVVSEKVPPEWECLNTFFRNQEAIALVIKNQLKTYNTRNIRVLDIGSSVLEPFLVSAILHHYKKVGIIDTYTVHCLDKSTQVKLIMDFLLKGDEALYDDPHLAKVAIKPRALDLTVLATIFPASESSVKKENVHLTSPSLLNDDIAILYSLGVDSSLIEFSTDYQQLHKPNIVSFGKELANTISFQCVDFMEGALESIQFDIPADIIISNFGLMYAIQKGFLSDVTHRLLHFWGQNTIFQQGSIYWKEALLIDYIGRMPSSGLFLREFAIREAHEKEYDSLNNKLILRLRSDALYSKDQTPVLSEDTIRKLEQEIIKIGGGFTIQDSMIQLAIFMEDVRKQDQAVVYACYQGSNYAVFTLPISILVKWEKNHYRISPRDTNFRWEIPG